MSTGQQSLSWLAKKDAGNLLALAFVETQSDNTYDPTINTY